jgi:acetyl esterase
MRVDAELKRAMALRPRLDYADPAAVRAKMDRFLALARGAGLSHAADDAVEVSGRVVQPPEGPAVPVRCYVPRGRRVPSPAIVYFHGGAFVIGHLDFEHPRCLEMAAATGCVVVSVDYRLAPEHPFPAGVDDCRAAYEWTLAMGGELGIDAGRVAVAGASAGGALAAAVALLARDRGLRAPAFQLLLYPVTDDRLATPSMAAFEDIPGWNRRNSVHMWRHYLGNGDRAAAISCYAAPARAADLRGLPPAYVMTCELDALRDEGIEFARSLMEAGVPTELHHFPGAFHGFDTLADGAVSRRARAEQYHCLRTALAIEDEAWTRRPATR